VNSAAIQSLHSPLSRTGVVKLDEAVVVTLGVELLGNVSPIRALMETELSGAETLHLAYSSICLVGLSLE
jgi:hypothetical protein